jgi:hypothetical protein
LDREQKQLESIKEHLKLYSEILKNLTILLIAVAGGTIGLLFKLSNPIAIPLLIMGLLLTIGILFGIFRLSISIREKLEELKEWEKNS